MIEKLASKKTVAGGHCFGEILSSPHRQKRNKEAGDAVGATSGQPITNSLIRENRKSHSQPKLGLLRTKKET